MQTRFEHYAATSMLGASDSPPRSNGSFRFEREWEERAFGIALALSKQGAYEWEDFRQKLISSIAEWEAVNPLDDGSWDYYERWLRALERLVLEAGVVDAQEWQMRTGAVVDELQACKN